MEVCLVATLLAAAHMQFSTPDTHSLLLFTPDTHSRLVTHPEKLNARGLVRRACRAPPLAV